ncbi:MAG TPA: hypothetical protein VK428_02445 [Acidimicrobiales bacterium]|nr:hypothetical protein [Acidimicrobiales bacterium]
MAGLEVSHDPPSTPPGALLEHGPLLDPEPPEFDDLLPEPDEPEPPELECDEPDVVVVVAPGARVVVVDEIPPESCLTFFFAAEGAAELQAARTTAAPATTATAFARRQRRRWSGTGSSGKAGSCREGVDASGRWLTPFTTHLQGWPPS